MSNRLYTNRIPKRTPKKRGLSRERSKSYKTEEAAKKAAEALGLKDYKIENLRSQKAKEGKFRIVLN